MTYLSMHIECHVAGCYARATHTQYDTNGNVTALLCERHAIERSQELMIDIDPCLPWQEPRA